MHDDILKKLYDIQTPPPIKWWPLAPGWYILLIILTYVGIYFFYLKYQKSSKYKKEALSLLESYQQNFESHGNVQITCMHISNLLRRICQIHYPKTEFAGIYGDLWLDFLNKTSKINFNEVKDLLLIAPFRSDYVSDNLDRLFYLTQMWIKQKK